MSNVLAISTDRITIIEFEEELEKRKSTFDENIMNSRRYIYQFVIAPDITNDIQPPIEACRELATSSELQKKLGGELT